MKTNACSALVLGVIMCTATSAAAQGAVGAPAIDERQDDQYGGGRTRAGRPAAAPAVPTAQQQSPAASAEVELVFWQSIADSTNPAEFEAYLRRFPNGTFSDLAQIRLEALRAGSNTEPASAARPAADIDAPRRVGDVFRDCPDCPEMVVLAGGTLAMGRYEVTVGEYRAFVSATGGGAGGGCLTLGDGDSWQNPGFPQTDRHPVACVSWDDAQEYVSWLSRRTGATYRLPTEAEWERASAGTPGGVVCGSGGINGTCPVGSYDANAAGLSDMVGNLREWTSDCWEGDCALRIVRGGSWVFTDTLRPGERIGTSAGNRLSGFGLRVSRPLD